MRALLPALFLLALSTPALAQPDDPSSLTLKAPPKQAHVIIDGAAWRCSGDSCVAAGGDSQRPLRACRRVVAELGPVSAFTWQGQALSAEDIAACNTAARK